MLRSALAATVLFLALAASPPEAAAWTWPVRGELITPYRNGGDPYAGGQHRGIDIAGPVGAPVVAAADGTVRFVGAVGLSGLTVSVRTSDGRYDTSYLHLSLVAVRRDAHVAAGQRLGAIGTSGRPSDPRPHLHFGVRDAGSRHAYHDPLELLPPTPDPGPREVPVPVGAPRPVGAPSPSGGPGPGPVPSLRPIALAPVAPRLVPLPLGAGRVAPARASARGPIPHATWDAARASVRTASGAVAAGYGHPRTARGSSADPRLGIGPDARHAGAPSLGSASRASRRQAAPQGRRAAGGGPDLGLALGCVGLLLAAALMGGTGGGRAAAARGRAGLAGLLRPLTGRA